MTGTTRLSINISTDTAKDLKDLASDEATNVTNVVRRSVAVYKFLKEALEGGNSTLQVVNREKNEVTTIALV